jgi:tetratricopeptide (TPR) repeat protein
MHLEHDAAEKRARFRKWLSSAAALSILARDTLLDDQRSSPPAWIFEHPIFSDWLANPNPSSNTIWISGTAGFGKSVLAAYLTESLKKKFADAPVTFFFCKEKEDAGQVHQIVRTLLQQLIAQSSAMSQRVMTIWEADEDIADLNANYRDYYQKLLLPILQTFRSVSQKPIFIIIDGLDELRESRLSEALALIEALQADSSLRVLLTSQPTKTINAALRTTVHLSLTGDDNLDNVETFVKGGLNETLTTLFNEIGVDPIKYFREKCLGMFLWVRAILDLIGPIDVNTDLQKILDNPPRSIGELYQKVLERLFCDLNEIELPWIQEIITWTVMSKRDLTLAEIEVAILLSGETNIKLSKSRVLNIEATLNKCATILRVTVNPSTKVKTIGLIHDSFIRFITNPNLPGPSGLARCFLVVKAEADCRLAAACISHLCNETLEIESGEIIPDERRKRLNAQFPMFNYATAYWAKHMNHKGTLKMQQQIALAVSNFLLRENFRNWITSVMAYTYNAYQGALYDPLSLSIPTSIRDAVGWIVQSPSFTEKILSSICDSCPSLYRRISLNNNLPTALAPRTLIRRWCAAIVAEVWKVGDPRRWEISFRCFEISRNLGLSEEEIDGKLQFENVVRMVAALAHSSSRKNPFRWLANEANVYIHNGRLESQTLADSALRLALESATGAEKAVVLTRLSSCFTNVYCYTDSLEDLNKSITYAENALETAETYRQYDYFHYFEPLSRQLFLRSKRTVQFASDAADRDWRRAVKLGMQALRLALAYDTYIEPVSPVVRSPEDSDWKSLPLLRYSSTESNEPIFHPSVFDVLNTLSFGFSIQPTNPTNPSQLDDLRELIDTCKKALTSMTEHNPAFWSTLGHALFSLHTTASRARKTSAEQQHQNAEDSASGTHSHQQPPNSTSASQELPSTELQESIECYRKALSLTPDDHPGLPMYTASLAAALLEIHGSGTHLDEAIDCWRRAIDMTPDGQMEFFEYLYKLGSSLRRRNGSITDTTEAMACCRKVIDLAPERHIYLPFAAYQLGIILTDVELVADVTEAIECHRVAIKYLPKGNPQFHSFANRLGIAFYQRADPPDDYTHALEYYQQAAESVSKEHQSYPIYVANAADALRRRLHDGDISKAIDNYRETLQLRSETDVDIPRYEHSLALALRERAWDGDLDDAIEHIQKALAYPGGSAKHYEYHNVLGLILRSRNGAGDLDRSVQCHRRALELFSERDEKSSHILENSLATAFYDRKADGDIRKAQQSYLRAIEIATRGDATSSEIAIYAHNLGNTYTVDDTKTDDLEIAVVWYQKAVELECEDHLSLARYLTSLVATLLLLGRGVDAIDFARIAIALTPEDHPQQPVGYQLLAECLRSDVDSIKYVDDGSWIPGNWLHDHDDRLGVSVPLNGLFTPTRSITIADESVSAVTWAIELSRRQKNDEQMAHSFGILSECLMGRYTLSKRIDDLEEADIAIRNIFRSKWRKDIKTRLFDMVRFGAVCLKRYVVAESQPSDALITFMEMADEISGIDSGSDGEVFGRMVRAMKSLMQCLLSKVAVEGNGRSLEY